MNSKTTRAGVCICADDVEGMIRFYRDTLGLHTDFNGGTFAAFDTAGGYLSLFMYSRKAFSNDLGVEHIPHKGINMTFEVALWLPTYADVDAEYERLMKLGVPNPTGKPQTNFGLRSFFITDPEGNLVEIGSMSES